MSLLAAFCACVASAYLALVARRLLKLHAHGRSSETRINPEGPRWLLPDEDAEWADMSHRDLRKHMDEEEK